MPWVVIFWACLALFATASSLALGVEGHFRGGRLWRPVRFFQPVGFWGAMVASVPAYAWWAPVPAFVLLQLSAITLRMITMPVIPWLWRHRFVNCAVGAGEHEVVQFIEYSPDFRADNVVQYMVYRYDELLLAQRTSIAADMISDIVRSPPYREKIALAHAVLWGFRVQASREAWQVIYAQATDHPVMERYNDIAVKVALEIADSGRVPRELTWVQSFRAKQLGRWIAWSQEEIADGWSTEQELEAKIDRTLDRWLVKYGPAAIDMNARAMAHMEKLVQAASAGTVRKPISPPLEARLYSDLATGVMIALLVGVAWLLSWWVVFYVGGAAYLAVATIAWWTVRRRGFPRATQGLRAAYYGAYMSAGIAMLVGQLFDTWTMLGILVAMPLAAFLLARVLHLLVR